MRSSVSLTVLALISLPAGQSSAGPIVFRGMCDASGAIAVDARSFAVANDEDNVVRIYDVDRGGPPLQQHDLAPSLPPGQGRKPAKKSQEMDLEAATTLGDAAYWLTSHGLNSKGKRKEARFAFFATAIPRAGQPLVLIGQPYLSLQDDLLDAPSLRRFDLRSASELPPKHAGALNLEGLTATPDGTALLIGFRNPIPGGRALLVPLLNPAEVMRGRRARIGEPTLLDLGGQGIRALSWWRGRYLILAGDHGDGGTPHLYGWDGERPPRRLPVDFAGLNPEGFFTPEDRADIVVLSDDGGVDIDGTRCKDLKDPDARRFRGISLPLAR
jgi:hypothetical protein